MRQARPQAMPTLPVAPGPAARLLHAGRRRSLPQHRDFRRFPQGGGPRAGSPKHPFLPPPAAMASCACSAPGGLTGRPLPAARRAPCRGNPLPRAPELSGPRPLRQHGRHASQTPSSSRLPSAQESSHDAPPLQPCLRTPSSIPALWPGSPFQRTGRQQPDFPRLHGRGRELACRDPRSPRQGQVHDLPEGQLRQGPALRQEDAGHPDDRQCRLRRRGPGSRVDQQFASTGGSLIRERVVQEFAATCPLRLAGSFSRAFPVPQPLRWRQT